MNLGTAGTIGITAPTGNGKRVAETRPKPTLFCVRWLRPQAAGVLADIPWIRIHDPPPWGDVAMRHCGAKARMVRSKGADCLCLSGCGRESVLATEVRGTEAQSVFRT